MPVDTDRYYYGRSYKDICGFLTVMLVYITVVVFICRCYIQRVHLCVYESYYAIYKRCESVIIFINIYVLVAICHVILRIKTSTSNISSHLLNHETIQHG